MRPVDAREELLAQHHRLRELLARALDLRERHDALRELMHVVLRAFRDHNDFEEALLRPLLTATGCWGQARIDRMLEEHREEHRVFLEFFAQPPAAIAEGLLDFIEEVDAHMAAEERVFLNASILRDQTA